MWEIQIKNSQDLTYSTYAAQYINNISVYFYTKKFRQISTASQQNQQNDLCAQRRLRSAWASA